MPLCTLLLLHPLTHQVYLREVNKTVRACDVPPDSLLQQHVEACSAGYSDSYTCSVRLWV